MDSIALFRVADCSNNLPSLHTLDELGNAVSAEACFLSCCPAWSKLEQSTVAVSVLLCFISCRVGSSRVVDNITTPRIIAEPRTFIIHPAQQPDSLQSQYTFVPRPVYEI